MDEEETHLNSIKFSANFRDEQMWHETNKQIQVHSGRLALCISRIMTVSTKTL